MMITFLLCTIVVLVLAPFSLYLSVKLGTYAYLRAHELFDAQRLNRHKEMNHDGK